MKKISLKWTSLLYILAFVSTWANMSQIYLFISIIAQHYGQTAMVIWMSKGTSVDCWQEPTKIAIDWKRFALKQTETKTAFHECNLLNWHCPLQKACMLLHSILQNKHLPISDQPSISPSWFVDSLPDSLKAYNQKYEHSTETVWIPRLT